MMEVILFILLSFVRVLIKNCKTIYLAQGDTIRTPLLAGINSLLAVNIIKLVVSLELYEVCIIAFFTNMLGAYLSIIITNRD